MRLIDADAIDTRERGNNSQRTMWFNIKRLIDEAPTIEAEPVRHSKWIGFPNNGVWDLKCDNCHRIIPFGQTPETMHYCPQCGAKMDRTVSKTEIVEEVKNEP